MRRRTHPVEGSTLTTQEEREEEEEEEEEEEAGGRGALSGKASKGNHM
jgi:CO dehydrogenase/acetyl-CoA synthase beta subunit